MEKVKTKRFPQAHKDVILAFCEKLAYCNLPHHDILEYLLNSVTLTGIKHKRE